MDLDPRCIERLKTRNDRVLVVAGLGVVGVDRDLVAADRLHQRGLDGRDLPVQHEAHDAHARDNDGVDEEPRPPDQRDQHVVAVGAGFVVAEYYGQCRPDDDQRGSRELATSYSLVQPWQRWRAREAKQSKAKGNGVSEAQAFLTAVSAHRAASGHCAHTKCKLTRASCVHVS